MPPSNPSRQIGIDRSRYNPQSCAMEIIIVRTSVTKGDLNEMAKQQFAIWSRPSWILIRASWPSVGNCIPTSLWGINMYPERPTSEWIEFDSMINVRPSGGNRSRYVERAEIRDVVTVIVNRLVLD